MTRVQDEAFHEIQLNGKQVVFLFMAATVVSVVIFLCGVLVGRGVRAERLMTDAAPVSAVAETTPPPQPTPAPAATPAASDPRAAAPPQDDLSYFNRLETKTPPREQLKAPGPAETPGPAAKTEEKSSPAKSAAETTVAVKSVAERKAAPPERPGPPAPKEPARASAPAPAASAPAAPIAVAAVTSVPLAAAAPTSDEPAGSGFAVQIAALNVRNEAEAIAKRLSSKGYAAYVLEPNDGTPPVYRVRIGKFPTRREAESIAAKLKKEEQFNPWVTR